ncbi:MAG: hypothetical protein IPI06_14105 [Gammaproteobacteria bacterium]|nr:hypothetical protein [Gammaproteobacteria bacterium]
MANPITDNNVLAEIVKAEQCIGWLAFFDFDGAPYYLTTRAHPVSYGGKSYLPVGVMVGIDPLRDAAESKPNGLVISMSGVDSALIAIARDPGDYFGRKVWLRLAWFREDDSLIGVSNAVVGIMSHIEIALGESNIISLHCETDLAAWNRAKPLYSTDATEQRFFSGDRFFDQGPNLRGKTIYWGGNRVYSGGSVGGGGGGTGIPRLVSR